MNLEEAVYKEVQRKALALLTRREHGVAELQAKLTHKGFSPSLVEQVMAELAAKGLVSDDRFIDSLVRSRLNKGYGPKRIKQDLNRSRVDEEKIEAALADLDDRWMQTIDQARRKKFGETLPQNYKEWVKQATFLQRRGFSSDQIRQALNGDAYE